MPLQISPCLSVHT